MATLQELRDRAKDPGFSPTQTPGGPEDRPANAPIPSSHFGELAPRPQPTPGLLDGMEPTRGIGQALKDLKGAFNLDAVNPPASPAPRQSDGSRRSPGTPIVPGR